MCDVSAKNLTTFCQCAENFSEAKLKSNGLVSLVEEIPRHNIEFAAWLLLIFFLQIYGENKLVGQKYIYVKCAVWRGKQEVGSLILQSRHVLGKSHCNS